MAQIYDLVKDRRVYSVDADSSVLEAARFMMEHNIGALPVLRDGELVGIFSERDIMNRVVAIGRMPGHAGQRSHDSKSESGRHRRNGGEQSFPHARARFPSPAHHRRKTAKGTGVAARSFAALRQRNRDSPR